MSANLTDSVPRYPSQDDIPGTITMSASVLPQPVISSQEMASLIEHSPSKDLVNLRGYSDSAITSCRMIMSKERQFTDSNGCLYHAVADSSPQPRCKPQQPIQVKARGTLQLPSFKTLGISSRIPDALLTPPDESIIDLKPDTTPSLFFRSSSYPPTNMPKTPSPECSDFTSLLSNNLSTAEASSASQPSMASIEPQATKEKQGTGPSSSSSEDEDVDAARTGWLVDAVETAVESIDNIPSTIVSVLCHSQPSPLANDATGTEATTAFHSMVSGIQEKINSSDLYIHITHAVPAKFSMNQIPNSPVTTPSLQSTGTATGDYFSLPTKVFSNAVVAMGHQDVLNSPVPSSPYPVVPPSSVTISLLERFIPPPSAEEYLHLFSPGGPSALVDRLTELSPTGGSLVFIYPTATGASSFANTYLGPLLHPLLRTMCSIHNLSMDFGAGIGSIGAVDQMLSFENLSRKIQILLRKLSRGKSAIYRKPPKFTLVHSSRQQVDLDRKMWTEWWAQQEAPRMRTVVDRYLRRGSMLPSRIGGQDVTAATLVQEVLDGVKDGRKYADYDAERDGVEVGVYVIKRTA